MAGTTRRTEPRFPPGSTGPGNHPRDSSGLSGGRQEPLPAVAAQGGLSPASGRDADAVGDATVKHPLGGASMSLFEDPSVGRPANTPASGGPPGLPVLDP